MKGGDELERTEREEESGVGRMRGKGERRKRKLEEDSL